MTNPLARLKTLFGGSAKKPSAERLLLDPELLVYHPEFAMDAVEVAVKDIDNFIKGKAHALGADYYYGYLYAAGCLKFVATKSDRHLVGTHLPILALAFFEEGDFFYKPSEKGGLVYLISHHGDRVQVDVGHEIRAGYRDLAKLTVLPVDQVPKTLFLRWSLTPKTNYTGTVLTLVFAAAMAFLFFSAKEIRSVEKDVQKAGTRPAVKAEAPRRISLATAVVETGRLVEGKGVIRKMTYDGSTLEFRIAFTDPNSAQAFIATNGGKNENGQVVFTPRNTGN